MERLTARGPVLVHFFDFAELNSVLSLPRVRSWHERYEPAGLTVIGVDTPRHPFGEDAAAVDAAMKRLRIPYPVLADVERRAWADYGCHGWPSLFLWSKGGALRWYEFGLGDAAGTEAAIRGQLDGGGGPPAAEPPADGAGLVAPSPEVLPGGSEAEPWRASAESPALEIEFAAGGAAAALAGAGEVALAVDGAPRPPIEVAHPGLYELVPDGPHAAHSLELRPDAGVGVYAISFVPGANPT